MAIQVLVYSVATGRLRRAQDPEADVANVIEYLNQVAITPGEARIVYNKQGSGADTAIAWQQQVNQVTGMSVNFPVDSTATDWYVGVDQNNVIQRWETADPACGDSFPGLTMVSAPFPTNGTYTYTGQTFIAPVYTPKSVGSSVL